MAYSQQFASYTAASETVQKTRQLVMLYDAVIRFLQQAKTAMAAKKYEERMRLIQKASNIILALHKHLDHEKGGEISKTLDAFYAAIDLRLLKLHRSNSQSDCDAIIAEIKLMRDAWDKIDHKLNEPIGVIEMPKKMPADFSA